MSIEVMKLSLEALENSKPSDAGGMLDAEAMNELWHAHYAAINALRTAIQQAESEPVCDVFWRVALVRSSHTPDQLIPWLCASPKAAATAEAHSSFIRWLTPRTHPAPGVPDGYALVPVEPTPEMLNVQTWDFSRFYPPREIWKAMLDAAQAQKGGE